MPAGRTRPSSKAATRGFRPIARLNCKFICRAPSRGLPVGNSLCTADVSLQAFVGNLRLVDVWPGQLTQYSAVAQDQNTIANTGQVVVLRATQHEGSPVPSGTS